jgi:hypothetical protein
VPQAETSFPLLELFRELVRQGAPLGARDYLDAVKALRLGFGLHTREQLQGLCEKLWVRNECDRRRITLLFEKIGRPAIETVREVLGGEKPEEKPDDTSRADGDASKSVGQHPEPKVERPGKVPVRFVSQHQPGISLPQAQVVHTPGEVFILTAELVVQVRALTIAWRRLRQVKRYGPRTELDIDATIARQCEQLLLTEPVLVPARRNQLSLVVLIDVSPSMLPWRSFNDALLESLRHSQLRSSMVYYFHNVPDALYEDLALSREVVLAEAIAPMKASHLILISDAGAARGHRNRTRLSDTRDVIKKVSSPWRPTVWLNPTPRSRWSGTTAGAIAKTPQLRSFELTEDQLIEAVDVLRGKQTTG